LALCFALPPRSAPSRWSIRSTPGQRTWRSSEDVSSRSAICFSLFEVIVP
jgi:hypothetical protein